MVWKGCIMKIEIMLTAYDYAILKRISDYSEISIEKLATGIITNMINEFDSSMFEFLEKNLPTQYFDDYSGRYIE